MSKPPDLFGFTHIPDSGLEATAGAVLLNFFANVALHATPPIANMVLQTTLTASTSALAAQEQRCTAAMAVKNVVAPDLVATLRSLALYVQQVIDSTPAHGLAKRILSGFDAVSTNRARQTFGQLTILANNNAGAGVLYPRVKPSRTRGPARSKAKPKATPRTRIKGPQWHERERPHAWCDLHLQGPRRRWEQREFAIKRPREPQRYVNK